MRERPYALNGAHSSEGADDRLSFCSGHTTIAFAAAASAGMLAQLRDDERWPWVYGVGFTAAWRPGSWRYRAPSRLQDGTASGAEVVGVTRLAG